MTSSNLTSRQSSVGNSLISDHESFHSCSSNVFATTHTGDSGRATAVTSDSPFIRTLSYELDSNAHIEVPPNSSSTSATISFNSGSSGYSAASAFSASSIGPDSAKYLLSPTDTYTLSLTRPSSLDTYPTTPLRASPTGPYLLTSARVSPTHSSSKDGISPTRPPLSLSSRTSPSHHYNTSRLSPSQPHPSSSQRSPEHTSVSPYTKRPATSNQSNGSYHTCRRSTSGISISKIAQRTGSQKGPCFQKKTCATRFPMYAGGIRVNTDGHPLPLEPVPGSDYENLVPPPNQQSTSPHSSQPPPPAPSAGTALHSALFLTEAHEPAHEAARVEAQAQAQVQAAAHLQPHLQRTSRSHTLNEIVCSYRETQPAIDRSVTTSAINAASTASAAAALELSPQSSQTLQDSLPSTPAYSAHESHESPDAHAPAKRKPSLLQRIFKFPLFRSRSSLHPHAASRSPPHHVAANTANAHPMHRSDKLNPIAAHMPVQPALANAACCTCANPPPAPAPTQSHANLEMQLPTSAPKLQSVVTIEVDVAQPVDCALPPPPPPPEQHAPDAHRRVTSKPPSGRDRRRRSLGVALHAAFGLRRPSPNRHSEEPQAVPTPGADTTDEKSSTVKRKVSLFAHAQNQSAQAERTAPSGQKNRGSNSTAYRDSGICRDSLCTEEPSDGAITESRADQSGERVEDHSKTHNGQWNGRRRSTTNPELASREFEPELAPIRLEGDGDAPARPHASLYDRRASTLGLDRPVSGSRSASRKRADSSSRSAGGFFARKILWRLRSKKGESSNSNKKELAASSLALSELNGNQPTSSERPLCFGPASNSRAHANGRHAGAGSEHQSRRPDDDEECDASPPRSTESARLRSKRMSLPACVHPDAQLQRLQRLHQLNAGLGIDSGHASGSGPAGAAADEGGGGAAGGVTSSNSIYQKARSTSRAMLSRDRIGSVSASMFGLSRKERRASLVRE